MDGVLAWKAAASVGKDTRDPCTFRRAELSAMTLVAARVLPSVAFIRSPDCSPKFYSPSNNCLNEAEEVQRQFSALDMGMVCWDD